MRNWCQHKFSVFESELFSSAVILLFSSVFFMFTDNMIYQYSANAFYDLETVCSLKF